MIVVAHFEFLLRLRHPERPRFHQRAEGSRVQCGHSAWSVSKRYTSCRPFCSPVALPTGRTRARNFNNLKGLLFINENVCTVPYGRV